MPSLQEYRSMFSVEAGPFVGPESYVVRATSGSDITKIVCSQYPITSSQTISSSLLDRPLFRPSCSQELDRYRYVAAYEPATGTITPDLPWIVPPFSPTSGNTYGFMENYTYFDLEGFPHLNLYQDLEGLGVDGIGERFEIGGPFDVPMTHRILNDALKQCWLIVELATTPTAGATRHNLSEVAPWLQDTTDVLQVGYLAPFEDRNTTDPFERIVCGEIERDGNDLYLNTGTRSWLTEEVLYLRCLKRAYDHCRAAWRLLWRAERAWCWRPTRARPSASG